MKELNELVGQAKFVADWYGSDWSSALCQDKDGKQAHEIICESRGESVISTGSNSNEASWLCDYLELCSPANILAIAEAFRALEQESQKNLDGALAWQQCAETAEEKLATAVRAVNNLDAERNALRAKLAELEKLNESRWSLHDGIARPIGINKDDLVYLKMKRQEIKLPYPAGMVNWKHDGGEFDVIAWASVNAPMGPAPAVILAELDKQEPAATVFRKGDAVSVCMIGADLPEGYSDLFAKAAPAVSLAELVPGERDLVAERQNGFYERAIGWNEYRAAILRNIEEQSQ